MSQNEDKVVREIDDLINELDQIKQDNKRTTYVFTGVLLVIMVGFAFTIKGKIESNFTPEIIQAKTQAKIQELSPLVPKYIDQLFDGVYEVYMSELTSEFSGKMPEFKDRLLAETGKVQARMEKSLTKHIKSQILTDSVSKKINTALSGSLANDENHAAFAAEAIGMMSQRIRQQTARLFNDDVDSLYAAIRNFPRDDRSLLNREEASRMFIHYSLNVFDHQLMAE